ncbi:MAG TPA: hypothetical protein VIG24_15740 [Acidimicrobiia bacterium]
MSAYNKFNQFSRDLLEAKHNFAINTFRVLLTDDEPAATNAVRADIIEIAAGNGYTAGGEISTMTLSATDGVTKVVGSTVVFTAAGGSIGPFRYAVLYNDTAAGDPLVCWFDYGSTVSLADTEQFTVSFDASAGIFTLS